MKNNLKFLLLLVGITLIFFWPIFKGFVPFPGDLLVSEYNPWKTYSYLGFNPGSYPNKAQYFDVIRQLYPYRVLSWDLLKKGEVPLWNPYNFSGAPLLADFQSEAVYPLNFPLLFFNQKLAWTILVLLQPLLAVLFTYLYSRRIGISSTASLLSSISYGFSYFMIVWLEFNNIGNIILWLPLVLLSIEHLFEKLNFRWSVVLVFSLYSALSAGHPQIFGYFLFFTILYSIFRSINLKNKISLAYVLFLQVLSLGVSAILLIPGIELLKEAARSPYPHQYFVDKVLLHWWHLAMTFVPDFFGNPATRNYFLPDSYIGKVTSVGLVPIFFIAYIFFRKRTYFTNFFLITAGVVLLLITANPLSVTLYKFNIPFVSSSAPNLSTFILSFSLSVLAGIGLDLFLKEKVSIRKTLFRLIPIVLIFAALWIGLIILKNSNFVTSQNVSVSARNLIYSTVIFAAASLVFILRTFLKDFTKLFLILLILLQIFDLFKTFHKFNPFVPYALVFPDAPILSWLSKNSGLDRFWGFGSGRIEANYATQYRIFSPDGLDPLYPRRYGEFIQSASSGKIVTKFTRETRSDAVVTQGNDINEFVENKARLKVLDSLSVKYLLFREDGSDTFQFSKDRFKEVYRENGWIILENLKAAPRAYLTSDIKTFKSKEEFEKLFFNSTNSVLLEDNLKIEKGEGGQASFASYSPGKMNLETKSKNENLLYVSETYFPGWKAYVDGNEVKIHRANYAFMSLVVPSGDHKISLRYEPSSTKKGFLIFAFSIILFALVSISMRFYKGKLRK